MEKIIFLEGENWFVDLKCEVERFLKKWSFVEVIEDSVFDNMTREALEEYYWGSVAKIEEIDEVSVRVSILEMPDVSDNSFFWFNLFRKFCKTESTTLGDLPGDSWFEYDYNEEHYEYDGVFLRGVYLITYAEFQRISEECDDE